MSLFRVTWVIDLDASSPRDAAEQALAIQRNPESIATVFDVWHSIGGCVGKSERIDLSPECEDQS